MDFSPARAIRGQTMSLKDIEVFFVKKGIGLHDDILLRPIFEIIQRNEFAALQGLRNFRIHTYREFFAVELMRHFFDLLLDLVADRLGRLGPSGTVAVVTGPAKCAL